MGCVNEVSVRQLLQLTLKLTCFKFLLSFQYGFCHPKESFVTFSLSKPNFFFSVHSTSISLLGTESCWKEGTNSLPVREKSNKMKACEAFLCRMTSCKNTTVCWKVTVEMASWEWVGEGYVYYLLMTSRSSLLSLWALKKNHPFLTAFSADSIWDLKIMLC